MDFKGCKVEKQIDDTKIRLNRTSERLRFELGQVLFPLHRQQLLLLVVTRLAGRYQVAFGAAAAARNRHDVVHRQAIGGYFTVAIVTDTLGQASLPPLAYSDVASFSALAANLRLIQIVSIRLVGHGVVLMLSVDYPLGQRDCF